MRWLAIIALLLSFTLGMPGVTGAGDMAHMSGGSAGDLPSDGSPVKKSDGTPAKKDVADHLRCGHSHLMDRTQQAQILLPEVLPATRSTHVSTISFDDRNPNPLDKPPRI